MLSKIPQNMLSKLGVFTGDIIPDNSTVPEAIQLIINQLNLHKNYDPHYDVFTGNGITSSFELLYDPISIANLTVSVGGVDQVPGVGYSLADGNILQFSQAVPTGQSILVRYGNVIPLSSAAANSVTTSIFNNPILANNSTVQECLQAIADALSRYARVKDFGAVGDGVTDDTDAIQEAIDTGKPVIFDPGLYRITRRLLMFWPGQIIRGCGRINTTIVVDDDFDLSGAGVIVFKDADPWSNEVHDIGIRFIHSNTTSRANLTNFPPAIYAVNHPRSRLFNLRIESAMTAVDWRGNSGGSLLFNCEISAFEHTVRLNGSLDTVRIDKLHQWPFNLDESATAIFYDGNTGGIESGRCDGLTISDSLLIGKGKQLHLYSGGSANTFCTVVNTNFDSNPNIVVEAGTLSLSSCMINPTDPNGKPIEINGGSDASLRVDGSEFKIFYSMANPVVSINSTSGNPDVAITDNKFYLYGDATIVQLTSTSGVAMATVSENNLFLPVSTTPTKPIITAGPNTRLIASGNRASDKGTGTGVFISVSEDNFHVIRNNVFTGWQISTPTSWTNMSIGGNSGIANGDFTSLGYLRGNDLTRRFTGNADGSGVVNISHGITQGNLKILSVDGFYKGGAGEMRPLTFVYADAASIQMSGAGASNAYRVTIRWTVSDQSW